MSTKNNFLVILCLLSASIFYSLSQSGPESHFVVKEGDTRKYHYTSFYNTTESVIRIKNTWGFNGFDTKSLFEDKTSFQVEITTVNSSLSNSENLYIKSTVNDQNSPEYLNSQHILPVIDNITLWESFSNSEPQISDVTGGGRFVSAYDYKNGIFYRNTTAFHANGYSFKSNDFLFEYLYSSKTHAFITYHEIEISTGWSKVFQLKELDENNKTVFDLRIELISSSSGLFGFEFLSVISLFIALTTIRQCRNNRS